MLGLVRRGVRYAFSVKPYDANKNYYQILSLSDKASQDEIKKAFRQLAKKYHPDSNKGSQDKFKEVNEAYQVLSDSSSKDEYDQIRRSKSAPPKGHYQQHSTSSSNARTQHQYQQQKSQYRGYQREQGWKDMGFREKFMHDLYRQQQAQFRRQFNPSQQEKFDREFRQRMKEATQKGPKETMNQFNEQIRREQQYAKIQQQERQRRRRQREAQQFRQYQDQSYQDSKQKVEQKINKIAQGIAGNVKGALKVGQMAYQLWNMFKKKK